jgi:hypothetical protein
MLVLVLMLMVLMLVVMLVLVPMLMVLMSMLLVPSRMEVVSASPSTSCGIASVRWSCRRAEDFACR